ncbi:MAG TPA: ElyC/SanA/YdcF family protein [Deltaproteobacteria bacterium]|nr:ElyC/SanA/YdcF family protein [Deltaproteobacteria bacterium]HQJ08055.1 ElyC/SanA/YdcF family protein [Deltaproteobacteria bacterium]
MFVLKKIVSEFFMPVPIVLSLLVIGIVLLWQKRRQAAAKIVLTTGSILLLFAGYGIISDAVLRKLEYQYPVLDIRAAREAGVKWVVVLAGAHGSDAGLPVTSQLAPETQVRLVEGIRIYRSLPGTRLLVSGGKVFDSRTSAELMASLAGELGVNPEDITLEDRSRDTHGEAVLLKPVLGSRPFVLVTSAHHMPRAMGLFKALGMQPIPAPACHYTRNSRKIAPGSFFPDTMGIRNSEFVFHEILGIVTARLMGQM